MLIERNMVDVELYGGYRGYLSHLKARAQHALGAYREAATVDWAGVARVVFVCVGNICRSPYAAARCRALGIRAVSLGLGASEGAPADPSAARNALARGLDLSLHRSARLESCLIEQDDLVIVFEPLQLHAVRQRCSHGKLAVTLLGIWSQPVRPYVHDPYGRSDRYFHECFGLIDRNVAALAQRLNGPRATIAREIAASP
jgi:protein-tyrosine phosphatase